MRQPDYIIERYEFGYLVKGGGIRTKGIPMDLFKEIADMLPDGCLIDPGIANALEAIMAVGTSPDLSKWRAQIAADLEKQRMCPEEKWLRGTDTGLSSMSIFAACVEQPFFSTEARGKWKDCGYVPSDCADFGRCVRLLQIKPEWEEQLDKVAKCYPASKWPKLVPMWKELRALYDEKKTEELGKRLREL